MKKNKIIVVYSSHLGEEEDQKFNKHISETIGVDHKIVFYTNYNQYSLTELYNRALDEEKEPNSIFVMCHNDIIFKTQNWGRKILNHFNHSKYGIIGIAGTVFVSESGRWWDDRSKMYGTVEHTNGVQEWTSEYSSKINGIQPVIHIDGLFMSIDSNKIEKKFNENYGKFHFYDLSFNIDNYLEGVDIGVVDNVRVLHKSVGQTNDEWELNRTKFVKEYWDELPIRLVPVKLRVLICCQFFQNYTGSEVSNYELSKELVKLGCEVTIISTMVGEPLYSKAKENGINVYHISQAPNFQMTQNNQLSFIKTEKEFDIIHINHKPIGEQILKMYPNTPAVMHIRSEVIPTFEEPIINPIIKRYISIRKSIKDYIMSYDIPENKIVHIDNPFDIERFNTNYKSVKNEKEVVLFIGTLDHLRRKILEDLVQMTHEEGQELWIIGADNLNYATDLQQASHVKYLGIKSNVEDFIKKCDYTAGIFKGRTTIEGYLCGKQGWIYKVDKEGNIEEKVLTQVPLDIEKYSSSFSAKKVFKLYKDVIDETWFE